jgi:hypothetical protein
MHFNTVGSTYHTTVATRARFASGQNSKPERPLLEPDAMFKMIVGAFDPELAKDCANLVGNTATTTSDQPPPPPPPEEKKQ